MNICIKYINYNYDTREKYYKYIRYFKSYFDFILIFFNSIFEIYI